MAALNSVSSRQWLENAIKQEQINFFPFNKLTFKEELGSGAFGNVYRVEWGTGYSPLVFAVKKLKKNFGTDESINEKTYREFIKELLSLKKVDYHPNILRFFGVSHALDTKTYMLVLEYADSGSLRKYLANSFAKLTGNDKLRLAREITDGVKCLHENNIIHRDLNSTNILVHQGTIKIGDLGLSKRIDLEMSSSSVLTGHPQYIEPQCLRNEGYVRDKKSDIFGIGVVYWELTSGKVPFSGMEKQTIILELAKGKREKPIPGTPQAFVQLYKKCWDENPASRPEISVLWEKLNILEWPGSSSSLIRNNTTIERSTSNHDESILSQRIDSGSSDGIGDLSHGFNQIQVVNDPPRKIAQTDFLEGAMRTLEQSLNSGKRIIDIKSLIERYCDENNQTSETLFNMLKPTTGIKSIASKLVGNGSQKIINSRNFPYTLLLGVCYSEGIGVRQDYDKAFEVFQLLADNENSYGQYFLGFCYFWGHGTEKDRKQAFEMFTKSAVRGSSCGQERLAWCYKNGHGTDVNHVEAFKWYKKSAEGRNAEGQYQLANCYRDGLGTTKSIKEARRWYQIAVENGHELSSAALSDRLWQAEVKSEKKTKSRFRIFTCRGIK